MRCAFVVAVLVCAAVGVRADKCLYLCPTSNDGHDPAANCYTIVNHGQNDGWCCPIPSTWNGLNWGAFKGVQNPGNANFKLFQSSTCAPPAQDFPQEGVDSPPKQFPNGPVRIGNVDYGWYFYKDTNKCGSVPPGCYPPRKKALANSAAVTTAGSDGYVVLYTGGGCSDRDSTTTFDVNTCYIGSITFNGHATGATSFGVPLPSSPAAFGIYSFKGNCGDWLGMAPGYADGRCNSGPIIRFVGDTRWFHSWKYFGPKAAVVKRADVPDAPTPTFAFVNDDFAGVSDTEKKHDEL